MEERLRELEEQVRRLTERLERLEATAQGAPSTAPSEVGAQGGAQATLGWVPTQATLASTVSLVGRTFLVLGGGFAIRALTDYGALPKMVGVAAGLLFALTWLVFSHRAAKKPDRLSGTFHGLAAALLGFPLLVEAATRLAVLPPYGAALGLSVLTVLLLWLSGRHGLTLLAWVGELFCLGAVVWLLSSTSEAAPLVLTLLVLAAGTLVLTDKTGHRGQRWAVALVLDFVVLRGVFSAMADSGGKASAVAGPATLVLALALLYLGALAHRTLVRARPVGAFEILQTLVVLGEAVATAVQVAKAQGRGTLVEGLLALALAACATAVAFRLAKAAAGFGLDVVFYSVLGLGLLLVGGLFLPLGGLAGVLWVVVALLEAWLGRRMRPALAWSFAAVLILASSIGTGLVAVARDGLLARPDHPWALPSPVALLVLAVSVAAYVLARPDAQAPGAPAPSAVPRLPLYPLLAACLLCGAGALVGWLSALAGQLQPPVLALVRTVLLVGASFSLAFGHRLLRRPEMLWLAYTTVALSGIKLLVEDLPYGKAATLFVAFPLFGMSLILVPKVARRKGAEPPPAEAPPVEAPPPPAA